MSCDNLDAAERAFRAANEKSPNAAALAGLGQIHQKRWTAAADATARVAIRAGDHSAAVEAYRRILLIEPGNLPARRRLGRLLADLGDEAGIAELRAAVDAAPESAEVRNDLAEALSLFGKFRDAARTFRKILRHDATAYDVAERVAQLS